jgi:hypothetical protein
MTLKDIENLAYTTSKNFSDAQYKKEQTLNIIKQEEERLNC